MSASIRPKNKHQEKREIAPGALHLLEGRRGATTKNVANQSCQRSSECSAGLRDVDNTRRVSTPLLAQSQQGCPGEAGQAEKNKLLVGGKQEISTSASINQTARLLEKRERGKRAFGVSLIHFAFTQPTTLYRDLKVACPLFPHLFTQSPS